MDSNPTTLTRIEETAARWLLRRDGTRWTAQEQAELDRWLNQDPSHRVAYIRLSSVWRETPRLQSLAAGLPSGVPAPGLIERSPFFALRQSPTESSIPSSIGGDIRDSEPSSSCLPRDSSPHQASLRKAARLVAPVLAFTLVGSAAVYYLWPPGTIYSTPIGGLAIIPTKDGSTITLNTDTQIRVELTDAERHIILKRGEAFFEVAHDPKRPFVVDAGTKCVTAIGTKFSVRNESDQLRVAVTEGIVRVGSSGVGDHRAAGSHPRGYDAPSTPVLLTAGSIATVEVATPAVHIERQPLPEVERGLSWRVGSIALNRTPLPDAIREFNRYSTRQLILEDDPELRAVVVGGSFHTNNVEGFLRLLEQGFDIQATSEGDRIVLRRK